LTGPPGLTAEFSLETRVKQLDHRLECATESVNGLPAVLRQRVAGSLLTEIAAKRVEVAKDLTDPLAAGTLEENEAWANVHALEIEIGEILQEVLMLEQGARGRQLDSNPVDEQVAGLLDIADALADELAARTPITAWQSYTVLGVDESFHSSSRAIKVRYPKPTIWELPAVAHELGHFVARQWSVRRHGRSLNVVDQLHESAQAWRAPEWHWLEELFADAFASYTLGPAYALSCVSRDFDPLDMRPSATHPAAVDRVDVALAALRRTGNRFGKLADQIEQLWSALEAESGATVTRCPASWLTSIVDVLVQEMPASGYPAAAVDRLIAAWDLDRDLADNTVSELALVDVLNAAWLSRIGTDSFIRIGEVGRRASSLMARLKERGRTNTWE